ncbi:membrane protease subunit [Streptomyces venezuelae]|uniref:Membrane protease subunit n=1 Tax=Streptomyces venezuelae TaxID=54571 RepID=A0A5P2B458_STRVZ|nr:membrane protease subunit [Streptomyces venezuelae]
MDRASGPSVRAAAMPTAGASPADRASAGPAPTPMSPAGTSAEASATRTASHGTSAPGRAPTTAGPSAGAAPTSTAPATPASTASPTGTSSGRSPAGVPGAPVTSGASASPATAASPPAEPSTATASAPPRPVTAAPRDRAPAPGAAAPTGRTAAPSAPTGAAAPAPTRGAGTPPGAGKAAGAEKRVDVPDFGRITGAKVAALAVPVAGVVRVVRRKNVIGSETTGSIPVHLLFRDEPEGGAPGANGDDGGPDTVAMAVPAALAKNGKAAIPAPAKTQQQTQQQKQAKGKGRPPSQAAPASKQSAAAKARPAPTADPDLVERPGAVLPGWLGVVGGALALAGCAAVVWWAGAVPAEAARMLRLPVRPYHGIHLGQWALLALGVVATLFAVGGLGRGRVGYAWVLTLFGDYRGTVRRTGLVWVSPLLLRRRVDVRLRHWRSEPLPAVDAKGTALDVVVLVVWRVRDTVRAALGVDGHEDYLREQVEAAMARVLSQLPADAFHEDAPTLRDAEAVGEALTRMLSAECAPVGVDVFSAQPTRIEYAPEVAAAMQRRRIAAIDAKHRDSVLTSVVDAVDDVVHRLTSRGLVELDDYERKALVKDLTVAFYTGRTAPAEGA